MNENSIEVCVLRRCGQLDGNNACCQKMKEPYFETEYDEKTNTYKKIGEPIILRDVMLDHLWTSIKQNNCAQYYKGWCLTRSECFKEQTYCYPLPLREKQINRTVIVKFAYYCVDQAEESAEYAAADAADAAAAAADAARYAADAAAAADAADADADAARYAAESAYAAAAREQFYREASEELERLIDAWGSPR